MTNNSTNIYGIWSLTKFFKFSVKRYETCSLFTKDKRKENREANRKSLFNSIKEADIEK